MSQLPFHPEAGIGPKSILLTPAMAKHNSRVDSLINARHKKTGKMQWSREGADNVLQIRATMASKEWTSKWQSTVLSALGAAA
jgi:hypothetical protein